jgi:hypothetical protein
MKSFIIFLLSQILLLFGDEVKEDEVVGSCSVGAINKQHKSLPFVVGSDPLKNRMGQFLRKFGQSVP